MGLTTAQKDAIAARGDVVVVAGAGTGKTRTLVERCVSCLLDEKPRTSLDEILMVTFTEAAAAEMRQRIRDRLLEESSRRPGDAYWQEQLALFETASIGTLHSFCFRLVREHFYELELDPQLSVMPEQEAQLLAEDTLETLFQKCYQGRDSHAEAVQQLIQTQGGGWDKPVREIVLRLHQYIRALPNPDGWLRKQHELFDSPNPVFWHEWFFEGVRDWLVQWLPALEAAVSNEPASKSAAALKKLPSDFTRAEVASALQIVADVYEVYRNGKKGLWLDPFERFFDEARFLFSLAHTPEPTGEGSGDHAIVGSPESPPTKAGEVAGGCDPLNEDWAWVRPQMLTLLRLTADFTEAFTSAKRELGVVDFQDLEQYALRLLWDEQANRPTKTAQQWRSKLRFVFVDEYQDINAAQDKIIEALSREGPQANRFLVGDVKQSIYRFRLANPHIFQTYVEKWGRGKGTAIPLADNFRSREPVLEFINSLFGKLMRPEVGGVKYDQLAQLRLGRRSERQALSTDASTAPCVELHLRIKRNTDAETEEESAEVSAELRDLDETDKEARLVALRLRELKEQQYPVWDEHAQAFRSVAWRDMAILLRSPSNKAESYAKEFSRLNLPLEVARGGFYQSPEVLDMLSLLQILDNPLQDVPVLALLHSPLVGLSANELARIRLAASHGHFWIALTKWKEVQSPKSKVQNGVTENVTSTEHGTRNTDNAVLSLPSSPPCSDTYRRVTTFLDRYTRWRLLARQTSLSSCLETILAETHYATWLRTQSRGEQRRANIERLVGLAQEFDQFQRQGLFRFLRFIEAQQLAETEPEVARVGDSDSVRLMSIHQSKGLEFPVVVVADLGKGFNLQDLRGQLILDDKYGLCPQVKPPQTGKRYPSLSHWLARRRQTSEVLGEELRLLYVATTRARDLLLLSGTVTQSKFNRIWKEPATITPAVLLAARSYADWVGSWFAANTDPSPDGPGEGRSGCLSWFIHDDTLLMRTGDSKRKGIAEPELETDPEVWQRLQQRLEWRYPFKAATHQPAKTSVSTLRRLSSSTEVDASLDLFRSRNTRQSTKPAAVRTFVTPVPAAKKASAAAVGTAHHAFLQFVALDHVDSIETLKLESQRLISAGILTEEEADLLDFKAIAGFWASELGRRVRSQAQVVSRELAFTARFEASELAPSALESTPAGLDGEYVVVQGVADLAVILSHEIWLIDFKTDAVSSKELKAKVDFYSPQLRLYSEALSRIYQRPVTEAWLYFLGLREAVCIDCARAPLLTTADSNSR